MPQRTAPQHTRTNFGAYELHRIGNKEFYIEFVPERSAYVHQICLAGKSLLWNYPDGDALTGNQGHRNLALLPFPNRLLEGEYTWNKEQLAFPVNKPDTRSAIHGFGPNARFAVQEIGLTTRNIEAKLTYLHRAAQHPRSYPFEVRFDCILSLDLDSGCATWHLSGTNLSTRAAPIGLGWHPYFLIPGGSDQWSIQMPSNRQVVLDAALPTGAFAEGLSPKQDTLVNPNWDDCFELLDQETRTVHVAGAKQTLVLDQFGNTQYTQLYVPPDGKSLAVEPMSCGVNAFQRTPDEVIVQPKQAVTIGMHISVQG